MMSNIDKFDEYAGRVFGILYEEFPMPIDLSIEEIMGLSEASEVLISRYEAEFAISTVKWLSMCGYLYARDISN